MIHLASMPAIDPKGGLESLAPFMMVAGVALIGFVLMMALRRKQFERSRPRPTSRERLAEVARPRAAADDVHAAGVEVLEIVRRLAAQSQNRAQRLEQLIDAADDRIERLDEAIARHDRQLFETAPRPGSTDVAAPAAPSASSDVAAVAAEMPAAGQVPAHENAPPGAVAPDGADALTVEIYRLADLGHCPVEIARELAEQVGKIELILALRTPLSRS